VPKHIDQLGSIENFQFSSLLDAEEIDRDKLKKYVFGVLTDKARAQDARDAAKDETADVQRELDESKAELSKRGNPDLAAKLKKSEDENVELKSKLEEIELKGLAVDVAEEKGLSKTQAKYLSGKTKEELEASADEFIKDNGITPRDPDEDPDDDETPSLRRTPRSTVNPLDPDSGKGPAKEYDFEAVAASLETNPFR
jgi:hypothetical protein